MKKPSHLKLKENCKVKKSKGVSIDFKKSRDNYKEIKELRQKLKERKEEKLEAVFIIKLDSQRKEKNS